MALPVIALTNHSTVLSDVQIMSVIAALQKQVSLDFKAYWQMDTTLTFLPKDQPLIDGWWQIVILDDPDMAGALGYHELSSVGTPLGKIFAKLDIESGQSWTVTLSHELLEMLADPWINLCAEGTDGKIYALEVADPVEADELGYLIDGVRVSDFVTPSWFEPTFADRYSFRGSVHHPLTLAPGGYISVLDYISDWKQIYSNIIGHTQRLDERVGSRRARRRIPRHLWRNSSAQCSASIVPTPESSLSEKPSISSNDSLK